MTTTMMTSTLMTTCTKASQREFSYGGIMMTPSELERVMREEDRERERELEERRSRNAPKFFVSINFTREL